MRPSVLAAGGDPAGRWTEWDVSTALSLTAYEASLCGGCGHPADESMSIEADLNNRDGKWHYEVPLPVICHACAAMDKRSEDYREHPQPSTLRFRAVRVDDVDPADDPSDPDESEV